MPNYTAKKTEKQHNKKDSCFKALIQKVFVQLVKKYYVSVIFLTTDDLIWYNMAV
jgi:hypothetical protein